MIHSYDEIRYIHDNIGFVALESVMASDLSVVNAARVSFNKHIDEMSEADEKLIGYLMKNKHGTPFEHNAFRFHIKAPIFIFREWQRHRIGSFNEWSARYSELTGEFYIPDEVRTQVGRPGTYTYRDISSSTEGKMFLDKLEDNSKKAYEWYQSFLTDGVAKEQARLFLPVNIYSEMYWTVNARSLMNFLSLRNSEYAMKDIRQYAVIIEEMFTHWMPVTATAFVTNDRVVP